MIETTVDNWHAHLRGEFPGGLDALLHDDCVFWSPVVFAPQKGKALTSLYLNAAYQVFPGDGLDDSAALPGSYATPGGFRYVKQVLDGNHAVLEFETMLGDTMVNGVDIITCDARAKIIEFKVMLRPRRAIEAMQALMAAMLEELAPRENEPA